MRFGVIVNTASLAPHAEDVTGSTTTTPHASRAYALTHFILPSYSEVFDEVIVVGEFREGEGYTYVPSKSFYLSAVDALHQRQEAFEESSSDVVAFVHDDHFLDPTCLSEFRWWTSDVWVPRRLRHTPEGAITLNNGFLDGYVGGHAAFYRREAIEAAPWGEVPRKHVWDVEHTKMLKEAGMRIVEDPALVVWDVEAAS